MAKNKNEALKRSTLLITNISKVLKPEPPKEEEKITLREIIKRVKSTKKSILRDGVIWHLEQLEKRIEGMPQKIREKYPLNSFVGIGWACEEILGEK